MELDELHGKALIALHESKHPPCVACIQRKLMIGYNRARRIMNAMVERGEVLMAISESRVCYSLPVMQNDNAGK